MVIRIVIVLFTLVAFQSCITSFNVGQSAETLPKSTLQVSGEVGEFKLAGGLRYGFFHKVDAGIYFNNDNEKSKFPSLSADAKYRFFRSADNRILLSTGLGFGTGLERAIPWHEFVTSHYVSKEEEWYYHGGESVDFYLPLYFTANLFRGVEGGFNPYLIYRTGYFKTIDNYPAPDSYQFVSMNKIYYGQAFSLIFKPSKVPITLLMKLNVLHYPHDYSAKIVVEASIGIAYSINFIKHETDTDNKAH